MLPTRVRGARTHNLKGIDLELRPGTWVAIVGPSGAGKSSLAFGTLYAEGQRRYVESFSAYARQFLERLPRPPVDELEPVPAGIAVDRQGPVRTSRSTVGTMTEIADYAKSLWARLARVACPLTGAAIGRDSAQDAAQRVLQQLEGARVSVLYPLRVADAEAFLGVREQLLADGYRRVSLPGEGRARDLDEVRPSDVLRASPRGGGEDAPALCAIPDVRPAMDVVVDRLVARADQRARLVEALESALQRGDGRAAVVGPAAERLEFSSSLSCTRCEQSFRDATPGLFSWNSPIGACQGCRGFGRVIAVDFEKVMPDLAKSVAQGGIAAWSGRATQWEQRMLRKHARAAGFPLDVPLGKLKARHRRWLLEGDGQGWPDGWGGLRSWFQWMESRAYKMHVRVFLSRYRKYERCQQCDGTRLKPEALLWKVDGMSIADFMALSAARALARTGALQANHAADPASALLLRELRGRLHALCDVGLGYLTLDRQSRTLSGGEAQRVSLTGALGSSLSGAMFVLDEPSVGLHPADVERLAGVVRRLVGGDNLVLAVEHDERMIASADRVIALGEGAGVNGGRVVFDGKPSEYREHEPAPARRARQPRTARGQLVLAGARGHNLAGVELRLPLGVLTCVTGVSGSGKSSLILETLVPALQRALSGGRERALPHDSLALSDNSLALEDALRGVVHVDQAPLGRTSRGNAATYVKAWDLVRRRFAGEPLALERGYGPGFFSSNVAGGRCEPCKGQGYETVEMQFLADVTFSCAACQGLRFTGPVLEVLHRGLNVSQVLELTVDQAFEHFAGDAPLIARLSPLREVGLGYLQLGQPLNTLSGGESQRLKLALALAESKPGSLIVLDEPTAGLHPRDVVPLLQALHSLVERGDSVVVVEHDMHVAAQADWVIDLGPGAGEEGGLILAQGPPAEVARAATSATAPYLARALAELEQASGARPRVPPGTRKRGGPRRAAPSPEQEPAPRGQIQLHGAREHNLRDLDLCIPREQLVVITGPSGSGKSTLAFDILYAEGQRRFLDTLSPYARQYMPQLPRPDVDRVAGVPPSVSLEQRMTAGGGNSTVATITEVAHFLRLLYARLGDAASNGSSAASGELLAPEALAARARRHFGARARLRVYAPLVAGRKGFHRELLEQARHDGFERALIDGEERKLTPGLSLARHQQHDIDLLVASGVRAQDGDALIAAIRQAAARTPLAAVRLSHGRRERKRELAAQVAEGQLLAHGRRSAFDPRLFSFNTRQGQCPTCEGRGQVVQRVGRGRRAREETRACSTCEGTRLGEQARAVRLQGEPITHYLRMPIEGARSALAALTLEGREAAIAQPVLAELARRLDFLCEVGVGYLGLDRGADSLSGGETQRVRLAAQLGSGLTGVLYVLDEPTIGLHPRDTARLLHALRALADKGNSVLVVEHDADTIRAADHVIDIGPGGGVHGGQVVAQGSPTAILRDPRSVTGPAIARRPPPPSSRALDGCGFLELRGAREHNLRGVSVRFPLGRLSAVTGVSGSGKSTLVRRVLLPAVRAALGLAGEPPGAFDSLEGVAPLQRAVEVDQSPIGRTPRSVPATYIGVWDEIRRLLASTPEARARGFSASRFSFNTADGRCPECAGQGALTVQMAFLPDVLVPCESCRGLRFTPETLDVKLHGKSAGELLELGVEQAAALLSAVPNVHRPLALLDELGLGYLKLGQPSNTLSGGEAQRLKLVAELGTGAAGRTLYVLDEPTTGLHRDDVARLCGLLTRFVERGDTLIVIEHNPDLLLGADWIVDLGPEGGDGGGRLVAQGSPAEIARCKSSHTGAVLRQ